MGGCHGKPGRSKSKGKYKIDANPAQRRRPVVTRGQQRKSQSGSTSLDRKDKIHPDPALECDGLTEGSNTGTSENHSNTVKDKIETPVIDTPVGRTVVDGTPVGKAPIAGSEQTVELNTASAANFCFPARIPGADFAKGQRGQQTQSLHPDGMPSIQSQSLGQSMSQQNTNTGSTSMQNSGSTSTQTSNGLNVVRLSTNTDITSNELPACTGTNTQEQPESSKLGHMGTPEPKLMGTNGRSNKSDSTPVPPSSILSTPQHESKGPPVQPIFMSSTPPRDSKTSPVQPSSASNTPPHDSKDASNQIGFGADNVHGVNSTGSSTGGAPGLEESQFAEPVDKHEDKYETGDYLKSFPPKKEKFEGFKRKQELPKPDKGDGSGESSSNEDVDDRETDSDESDSSVKSSDDDDVDPDPIQMKNVMRNAKYGKMTVTNVRNVRNAAIGSGALFVDNRRMPAPPAPKQEHKKKKKTSKQTGNKQNGNSSQRPAPLPAARPDNTENIADIKVVVKAEKSVGIIHGPGEISGTVFRVGDEYVMTAWHVVDHLIGTGTGNSRYFDETKLSSETIFVDFQFIEYSFTQSDRHKFSICGCVEYHSVDLDVAVLRLKNKNHERFPDPLTNFEDIDPTNYGKPIFLVGHPSGQPKKEDPRIELWNPYPHRMKKLREWSQENFDRDGYGGIEHKEKLVFDCTFRHGASGGPGISKDNNGNPVVVTILLRGFPDFYYYKDFTEEEKESVPADKMKQQGVRIEAVKRDMREKNVNLFNNIFERNLGSTVPHSPIKSPTTEGPSALTTNVSSFGNAAQGP